MKKLTILSGVLALSLVPWSSPLSAQTNSDTGAAGGNNTTPKHNVNNTGGVANGQGTATSGSATSSTSGGNPKGGETSSGKTSSGATTHVDTKAGATPGDGNSGATNTPPSGVTPGTGTSPNPQ